MFRTPFIVALRSLLYRTLVFSPHSFFNTHYSLLRLLACSLSAILVSRFLLDLQEVGLRSVKVGSDESINSSSPSEHSLQSFGDSPDAAKSTAASASGQIGVCVGGLENEEAHQLPEDSHNAMEECSV